MNARKLEDKIRSAIEDAIWEFESDEGELTDIEIEAHIDIDESGDEFIYVHVYE